MSPTEHNPALHESLLQVVIKRWDPQQEYLVAVDEESEVGWPGEWGVGGAFPGELGLLMAPKYHTCNKGMPHGAQLYQ